MSTRTAFLLGAGASRDAGLPLTEELARLLVEDANAGNNELPPDALLLNFVYAAMVGHQGEDGKNPLRAVNVETLISAVRLLRDRETHEVAPFVNAWKPGVLGMQSGAVDRALERELHESIKATAWSSSPGASRGDIDQLVPRLRAVVKPVSDRKVFDRLEVRLLQSIRNRLAALGDVNYLSAIAELARLQAGGADVISLNYDLAVETLCKRSGVPVHRGIDAWIPGKPLEFTQSDGTVNLIKMHGSLDWTFSRNRDDSWLARSGLRRIPDFTHDDRPWIVIGDREKLATDGPTLALHAAAQLALTRADRLIVVGFSFSDSHVNNMIRDWPVEDEKRTLVVLDPGWTRPTPRSFRLDEEISFLDALRIMAAQDRALGPTRVRVVKAGARDGLAPAVEAEALPQVSEEVSVRACLMGAQALVRVTNHGLEINASSALAYRTYPTAQAIRGLLHAGTSGEEVRQLEIGDIPAGASVEFLAVRDPTHDRTTATVGIQGETATRSIHQYLDFEWPPDADST